MQIRALPVNQTPSLWSLSNFYHHQAHFINVSLILKRRSTPAYCAFTRLLVRFQLTKKLDVVGLGDFASQGSWVDVELIPRDSHELAAWQQVKHNQRDVRTGSYNRFNLNLQLTQMDFPGSVSILPKWLRDTVWHLLKWHASNYLQSWRYLHLPC